jgi:hypothetical protein
VSSRLFWRAGAIQIVLTGGLFVILLVTVPHHFFDDWGFVVGPVIWVACSLAAGRILDLPVGFTLFCAAAGAVAGTLVGLVFGHEVGIVAGVGVFAACCAGYPEDVPPRRDEPAVAATAGAGRGDDAGRARG